MIVGIGTDIVQIDRIEETLARLGESFVERILSPAERLEFQASAKPHRLLAKRFAAKEAVGKALGTGIGQGVSWQHIEITHNDIGAPSLILSERARERFEALGGSSHHISISDEEAYAVAFVVLS